LIRHTALTTSGAGGHAHHRFEHLILIPLLLDAPTHSLLLLTVQGPTELVEAIVKIICLVGARAAPGLHLRGEVGVDIEFCDGFTFPERDVFEVEV
jgi:hypothetical protein